MKKIFSFIAIASLLGCVSQKFISKADSQLIPNGAKIINAKSDKSPNELFQTLYTALVDSGFRFQQENSEKLIIATDGKDIGQSTLGRAFFSIKKDSIGSLLTIRPEWKPGTDAQMGGALMGGMAFHIEWADARWGETGRPERTFAYFVSIAKKITTNLTYK